MKKSVLRLFTALILLSMVIVPMSGLVMAEGMPQPIPNAPKPPPKIQTSWTITNETWMEDGSWFDPADGDDITINSGGIVHQMWNWSGSDGSVGFNGITVNLGGIYSQHNGTTCLIKDTYKITITEGSQWRSLGTSGSRCAITGSSTATTTHYIWLNNGGYFYTDYTDISNFRYGMLAYSVNIEMSNSTITGIGSYPILGDSSNILLIGSTITAPGAVVCFILAPASTLLAIDCTITSNTDNRLLEAIYSCQASFANCTYQGVEVNTDDFPVVTQDLAIRIYEESAITESNSLSDVIIGASHPSMDTEGMLYDDTNYLKIPGYLSIPPTVTGTSTAYLLKKSAYWPSGTAVADRTWVNWSNGAASVGGTNQKWTVMGAKVGYVTDSTDVWAGENVSITLNATSTTTPLNYMTNLTDASGNADGTMMDTNDQLIFNGTFNSTSDITDLWINASVYDSSTDSWQADLVGTTSISTSAGIEYNFTTEFNGNSPIYINANAYDSGEYYVKTIFNKTGVVVNATSYSQFSITEPVMQVVDSTLDAASNYKVVMGPEDTIYYDADITVNATITNVWLNASVYNAASAWQETLVNQAHSFTGGVQQSIVTDIVGSSVIFNSTNYSSGNYFVQLTINKTGTITSQNFNSIFNIRNATFQAELSAHDATPCLISNTAVNYSYGQTLYLDGNITINNNVSYGDMNITIDDWRGGSTIAETSILATNYNFSTDVTADIVTDINSGSAISHALNYAPGTYIIRLTVINTSKIDIDTHTFATFIKIDTNTTQLAIANASAYNNISTAAVNLTNRFEWNETAYFNGTLGTAYDTADVIINITINNATAYITTLYNGTHSFTGGANESLTDVAGYVLNHTSNVTGEYKLIIEMYKSIEINRTIVTEGFTVVNITTNVNTNVIIAGGLKIVDPVFFEWDLKEALKVQFHDRTKTESATDIISFVWMFGDGNGGIGANPLHQYQMPGEYNVTVYAYFTGGEVESYSTTVRVVDNTVSWFMYIMVGLLVFIGILIVGVYAVRNKSERLSNVMYIILGTFIMVSIIAMQRFIS